MPPSKKNKTKKAAAINSLHTILFNFEFVCLKYFFLWVYQCHLAFDDGSKLT